MVFYNLVAKEKKDADISLSYSIADCIKSIYGFTMKYSREITREKQMGGGLNRYDFAYAGRDIINKRITSFKRITPSLIKASTNKVDRVAEKKYNRR